MTACTGGRSRAAFGRAGQAGCAGRLRRYDQAFADLDAPFAFVDLDAMWGNAEQMLSRAGGKPIRVASKSLRCRLLQRQILDSNERFDGLMTFTLRETLWLAGHGFDNLLLAYPSTDRAALRELGELTAENPEGAPIVMVDSVEHLDLIEAPPTSRFGCAWTSTPATGAPEGG